MDNINNLVLGTSDNNGLTTLGFLIYMYNNNKLNNIKNIIAVDSGAIIALLICCKIDIMDMIENMLSFNPQSNDFSNMSIFKEFGIFKPIYIKEYFNKVLISKFKYIPTLKKLYEHSNIDLTFVSYNLTDSKVEYFNHTTHPNMLCIEALVMSYIIPFKYTKYNYNNKYYIGGIIVDPHPIDYYKEGITLAIYTTYNNEQATFMDYCNKILNTPINKIRENMIVNESNDNIININISISNNKELNNYALLNRGYIVAKNYLNI